MMKKSLFTLLLIATIIGYFTHLNAQEIIEYDYVNTNYEDGTGDTNGGISKIRIRFENEKVFVNEMFDGDNDWQKESTSVYAWIPFYFITNTDYFIWFKDNNPSSESDELKNQHSFEYILIISKDRENVIFQVLYTDEYKKASPFLKMNETHGFIRSKRKPSKKPSWMK